MQVRGQPARAMGTVLHLQGRVLDASGKPMTGAIVEIWQCDWQGLYDHPRQPGRERRDSAFQGYGKVATDTESRYGFRTLKPVAYPGRTPHIHYAVKMKGHEKWTTQCYVKGHPGNEKDGIWRSMRDEKQRDSVTVDFAPMTGAKAAGGPRRRSISPAIR